VLPAPSPYHNNTNNNSSKNNNNNNNNNNNSNRFAAIIQVNVSAGTPVKNWRIFLEQSFAALVMSTSLGEDARVLLSDNSYAISVP